METIFGYYCKEYPNISYLHEEDMDTYDKFSDLIERLNDILFSPKGIKYLKQHFSIVDWEKPAHALCYYNTEELLEDINEHHVCTKDRILVWNKDDVLKNMTGIPSSELPEGFKVLFVGPKLPLTAESLNDYLKRIKDHFDLERFNIDLFNYVWDTHNLHKFFDVDDKDYDELDYHFIDIYLILADYSQDLEYRLEETQKQLDIYLKEKGLPLYERTIPDNKMRYIVKNLEYDPRKEEKYRKAYVAFLDKLAQHHDKLGLELKAYAYYGGNEYVKEDYKTSEQCLLELLNDGFDDNYADTLGYIYYYGRVNKGIPEYDKAFQYFMMASIAGNIEATYKLGDMFKNGYGVVKNEEAARQCYDRLYPIVYKEFCDYPMYSNLADVALRLGSYYTNEETAGYGARLFLEALLSIKNRNGKFDSGVKRSILKCLFDLYSNHKDDIVKENNLANSMLHFKEFTIHKFTDFMRINSTKRDIIFDLEKQNCALVYHFDVNFEGEVVKDTLKKNNRCDSVKILNNNELHFQYKGKDVLVIKDAETEILFEEPLVETKADENIYHVAICQYTKGQGRKYTFLIDGKGSLNDDWIITENKTDIYPIEFKDVKGYELPCDAKDLKHIIRK